MSMAARKGGVVAPPVPKDLAAALKKLRADKHFAAFPPFVRRGILEWIDSAKRADTRERRIAETARLAAMNIQINNWRWIR
jgi:uncharacterized protein YdeI (YjbR/CyaY-like superfamily)